MLYMGYVGFSVAFAFAIAALLGPARRRLGALVATVDDGGVGLPHPRHRARLVVGVLRTRLGRLVVLGSGRERSFMPWLVGTALVHSLAVTEKRGSFKNWTVLLAISAFSLSLLGTFLVRSGVLTSVHAFATDPRRGVFILVFLVAVIGSSLALFAWRAPKVGLGGRFALVSRESLLLTNNVLLVVACASVLLGTLYPLLIDALGAGKLSVGPPYFDAVFVPLMLPAVFLMGVAPFARWKQASFGELARTLRWAFRRGGGRRRRPLPVRRMEADGRASLLLATWIVFSGLLNVVQRVQSTRAGGSFIATARRQPRSFFGMHLAHTGIAVFIVGVAMVGGYQTEKDVKMEIGDTVSVGGYSFRFNGVNQGQGPNYRALVGDVDLIKDGTTIRKMFPEKRFYVASSMPMTEAAIDTGLLRDVYVSLGEPIDKARPDAAWAVRVYHKPFVDWIWGGCVLMGFGGLLALSDRRYRIKARAPSGQPAAAATASLAQNA
jgi:cytochrome c-type biogenesis protein CcmF